MKGLLQSKRFRKNLKKWLCMYVGALLLLTTVITYSKYMSKFNVDEEARPTKFDIAVNYINTCDENNENCKYTCDDKNPEDFKCTTNNGYRPTSEITYDFKVTPNLEVNTWLIAYIYINKDFQILKFEDITDETADNGIILYQAATEETSEIINKDVIIDKTENKIRYDRHLELGDINNLNNINEEKKYRITVKYNYDETTYSEVNKENLEVVKVGYSAKQEK